MKESEERYRKLVELAPELISVLSGEEITYINQQGVAILHGNDSSELVGRSFMEMVHPDSREIMSEYIARYAGGYTGGRILSSSADGATARMSNLKCPPSPSPTKARQPC